MFAPRIALIGDFDPSVTAHQAISLSLTRAADDTGLPLSWIWVGTSTLRDPVEESLAGFDGLWCVPASPYASTSGALSAIRFARERGRPFLGTCGGFQHALLDYASRVWGLEDAAHAELDPAAADPVIAPLTCALVERRGRVRLVPGTRLAGIYGAAEVEEEYHCRYGLNPEHAARLADGPLVASAHDDANEVRAVELEGHPFFIATLFQPERASLTGRLHPLIRAFIDSAVDYAASRRSITL